MMLPRLFAAKPNLFDFSPRNYMHLNFSWHVCLNFLDRLKFHILQDSYWVCAKRFGFIFIFIFFSMWFSENIDLIYLVSDQVCFPRRIFWKVFRLTGFKWDMCQSGNSDHDFFFLSPPLLAFFQLLNLCLIKRARNEHVECWWPFNWLLGEDQNEEKKDKKGNKTPKSTCCHAQNVLYSNFLPPNSTWLPDHLKDLKIVFMLVAYSIYLITSAYCMTCSTRKLFRKKGNLN